MALPAAGCGQSPRDTLDFALNALVAGEAMRATVQTTALRSQGTES